MDRQGNEATMWTLNQVRMQRVQFFAKRRVRKCLRKSSNYTFKVCIRHLSFVKCLDCQIQFITGKIRRIPIKHLIGLQTFLDLVD